MLALGLLSRRKSVGPRDLQKLSRLVAEQIREEKYRDAAEILSPNMDLIRLAMEKKLFWTKHHHVLRRLKRKNWTVLERISERKYGDSSIGHGKGILAPLSWFRHLVPDGEAPREAAYDIIYSVSSSDPFMRYIALVRLELFAERSRARPPIQVWVRRYNG